ncbi:MAG: GNAT family N-acetyltransferase [Clostridiales bacterium]|nr:GNAT family N-acetyltransferase [Clostridiales bacterium]
MEENITIRLARPDDAAELVEIYAPYVLKTAITYEYEVPSVEEFAGRIRNVLEKYPYLLAERNGKISGYTYAGAFSRRRAADWSVETSIYIRESARGLGIGRRLYEALENILREQGIRNLNAAIAAPVGADDEHLTRDSIHFHSHMGYRFVGEFDRCGHKFGRWYDLVWMEKHIGTHMDNQPRPKTLDEVRSVIAEKYNIR